MSNVITVKKIIAINCFDLSPNFSFETHTHKDWEFIYADSGTLDYETEGKRNTLSRGEIVFHRPGVAHGTVCDGVHSASFFNMIISTTSRDMQCFENCRVKVPLDLIPLLRSVIDESELAYRVSGKKLVRRPDSPDDGEQTVRNLTELFLLKLRRHILNLKDGASNGAADEPSCELSPDAITEYLEEHVCERITLDSLAEHFHFGKTHLCVQFKKKTGNSIIDTFLDMKLAKAKVMLRESSVPIQTVAEELGFDSPEYFSRLFKKRIGHSPTDFRKMLITGTKVAKK